MRIGSFLLGGVVGASAVWILSNRNHPVVNMMKLVSSDAFAKNKQKSDQNNVGQADYKLSDQSRADNASLIRSIIEKDPQLKEEFDSITEQASSVPSSNSTPLATQH